MKAYNIRYVVISPGGTNVCLTTSLMNDPYFKLYSCVDERSAAYMACGMAEETGEVIAICCTGATASRNYVPALTEAFYRKLPILVLTTSQFEGKVGHLFPQVTDRWKQMNDIVCFSTHIPADFNSNDEHWHYNVEINKALIALKRNGGGPVHINLATNSSTDFSVSELPAERVIHYYEIVDEFPLIESANIAIFVGNHKIWKDNLISKVEEFCEKYNAVILTDHTSNYSGKYKVEACVVATQNQYTSKLVNIDLMIHIGDVSGSYMKLNPRKVWRVNADGEIRDTFYKLDSVFDMSEDTFFAMYNNRKESVQDTSYYKEWKQEINSIRDRIVELPFSNAWIAKRTASVLPQNSEVHFGILNSLRSWNYFHIDDSIDCFSNTGGFGIDGCLSAAIGASFMNKSKIYYCILGDLAFFYDMNCIGNRHISSNVRIIMINNGCGAEFHIPACVTVRAGIDKKDVNEFIAAQGHYGIQSEMLVKNMAENLGFKYIGIHNKVDYEDHIDEIVSPTLSDSPLFIEVFTNSDDDAESMRVLTNLLISPQGAVKQLAKSILGEKNVDRIKKRLMK